jgi:hypothetical protein
MHCKLPEAIVLAMHALNDTKVMQWNDAKGYHGDKTGADDLERQ